ncbi:MAG: T9SS type A sorting domain-containing protein [Ignavibacteriales bacterium]|nr:T9SS type A sorting domain-containing protein [Ignavibacteriales bacterium]
MRYSIMINPKKILLLMFSFSSIIANGQWILQNRELSGPNLYDIKFINRNTGWVCGSKTIMKTTNGGFNWIQQTTPATNKNLNEIFPIDSNLVYCVGSWETILKTTNGGNNWIAIRNGPMYQGQSYLSLYFTSKDTGWIAGEQYIMRTLDGCQSFDSTYLNHWLYSLHFKNSNTGLGVGAAGGVFKTTNSGINWIQINIVPEPLGWIYNLSVIDNKYCYFVERQRSLYRSTNFGDTWDSICSVPYFEGINPDYCTFSSLNTGWVGGPGRLIKSTDGGYIWRQEYLAYGFQVLTMYFLNDNTGWIAGGKATIMHTTTGGEPLLNILQTGNDIPSDFSLEQNYPNPFNSMTNVKFEMLNAGNVKINVYDITGREVALLVNKYLQAGTYEVRFESRDSPSGIYFYRMEANGFTDVKRMILLK